MEKPKLSIWGIVENALWDGIKCIGKVVVPKSFGAYMAGIGAAVWQWASSSPATTIAVIACLFVIGYERWDALRERRRQKTTIPLSPKPNLGDFIIDYAGYGLGPGQYRNVTDQVRSLMKNGKLQITVGPEDLQCEVYSGKPGKHLLVIYSYREDEGLCQKTDVYQRMILP